MNLLIRFVGITGVLLLLSCQSDNKEKIVSESIFVNLIDICFTPHKSMPESNCFHTGFADKGAWHGYFLPETSNEYGGFTGPYIIAGEYPTYLAKYLGQIGVEKKENGTWTKCCFEKVSVSYLPGRLEQELKCDNLELNIVLSYADARTTVVTYEILNTNNERTELQIEWKGEVLQYKDDLCLKHNSKGIDIEFKGIKEKWNYLTGSDHRFAMRFVDSVNTVINGDKFTIALPSIVKLARNEKCIFNIVQSYTFTADETLSFEQNASTYLKSANLIHENNQDRWQIIASNVESGVGDKIKAIQTGMKALVTLNTNRRSAAGKIRTEGIVSNTFNKWSNGIWAWDTWKQSVSLAPFLPEIAKNNIRCMFDYQVSADDAIRPWDEGMILDCIFYYDDNEGSGNWNERNSNPPLAAWAVWQVFEHSNDTSFVVEMLPGLVRYHNWWYRNRDHDGNEICEYGCTVHPYNVAITEKDGRISDHRIEAAAWEGGGDHFVNFDKDLEPKILDNYYNDRLIGYSMNQESAGLNSFLVAEKRYLSQMFKLLGYNSKAQKYEVEAEKVCLFIRDKMFDGETGFFYDVDINSKERIVSRVKGAEGWIPLWAEVATQEQAKAVVNNMMDETQFNTKEPFSRATKDNLRFDPKGYRCESAWTSSALFGLKGMRNYGFNDEAKLLANKIVLNAEGLCVKGQPIHTNDHLITKGGLSCYNYSWSSAHLLMILNEFKGELFSK